MLRRALARAAESGFALEAGPEVEFFLSRSGSELVPLDHAGYFDLTAPDVSEDFRKEVMLALAELDVPVEMYHHEDAPSQHEIDLAPAEALTMADSLMTLRLAVKEVAPLVEAPRILRVLKDPGLPRVNVPDVPHGQLKGERVTRLGKRHKAEPVIKTQTPRGETCYWVGAAGAAADAGEGTDFDAIERGYVSVTPLQIDLTNHGDMPRIAAWLSARAKTDANA